MKINLFRIIFSIKTLFLVVILINLYFASWFIARGELDFHTDVARDFLLFEEIEQKKLMLIGPRSSTSGLFHGPTWLYLTYPGYFIGNGDPVIMGWYWMFLIIVFLIGSYFATKALFGMKAAWIYAILLSGNMIFYATNLFNPHGALFIMPLFLYSIIRYHQTDKVRYLLLHVGSGALIIQFQMAVGIPLMILSILYFAAIKLRKGRLRHLLAFILLFMLLGNFFVFEVRHNFLMTRSMLSYAEPVNAQGNTYDYLNLISGRIDNMMNMRLTTAVSPVLAGGLFTLSVYFIVQQIKARRFTNAYILISYFYIGYILLTFVNKGIILHHQILPMIALTNLVFASFVTLKSKKLFIATLIVVVYMNLAYANWHMGYQKELFMGKDQNSWLFLSKATQDLIKTAPQEFGYFVYSPDAYAYQPHYAMKYWLKVSGKNGSRSVKKSTTYVLAAPPPPDNPEMQAPWWIYNKARITSAPTIKQQYNNRYSWTGYKLTSVEIQAEIDRTTDIGIFFR